MSKRHELEGIGSNVELGKRGPRIKDNSGVIEHKNQDDDAYAVVRGDHPVGENDLATKQYVDTRTGISVVGQIDGGSPPVVPALGTVYVCTTAGGVYTLNTLYRSDGSAWVELSPVEGMSMITTDALSGGTVTFLADHLYLWDEDATEWADVGPNPGESGVVKTARLAIGFADVGTNLLVTAPAGSVITEVTVNVTQAWDQSDVTLEIGDATDTDRLMTADGNDLTKVDEFIAANGYLYGASTAINVAIDNNAAVPTTGIALVIIHYDLA